MTDPSKISELIERSSLGTAGARSLRGRTPPDVAQRILNRAAEQERAKAASQSNVADLLQEICDGDPAAWDEIFRRYEKIVSTTVQSFRLPDADARAAMEMTWLRLAENAHRLQFPDRLGGWLVTTARRECSYIQRQAKSGPNLTNAVPETTANPSAYPEPPTPDLTQRQFGEVIEGLGVAGMSKTATIEGGVTDSNQRKSGPLEKTWMERHQVRTDCKCDTVVKEGLVTYVCTKCGKEI